MSTLAWADVAIMCAASLLFIGVLCTVEIVRQKLKRRRRARERRPICDACKTDHGHTTTRHMAESRDREAVLRGFREWLDRAYRRPDAGEVSSFVDQVSRYGR